MPLESHDKAVDAWDHVKPQSNRFIINNITIIIITNNIILSYFFINPISDDIVIYSIAVFGVYLTSSVGRVWKLLYRSLAPLYLHMCIIDGCGLALH